MIVIYLLTKEFFDEKISLIAAFLLAIAPFHIQNTLAEMDVMAMFFSLLGLFLFVKAIKTEKKYYFYFSGIFLGLGIYTKVYPLLFIPSLIFFFIYYNKKQNKKISKQNIKNISIFLIVVFIFTIPALTHNYLLYKDKGFMDLQFTRTLGFGKNISAQYYSWDHQFEAKNDWKGLILGNSTNSASKKPTLLSAIDFIRLSDPITFYLGIIGIIIVLFLRKNYRSYAVFFLFNILLILPFLASLILLPKHFIFLELLIIPLGALAAGELDIKISKIMKKTRIKAILFILLLISLILLGLPNVPKIFSPNTYNTYGKSHMAQIIEFKDKNIPENALVVGDSRIYRGQINWAFQGRPYLEGMDFIAVLNNQDKLEGQQVPIETYFFECIPDDCGWGTVKNQPEFNKSMESLVDFFKENGQLIETISMPKEREPYYPLFTQENKEEIINIYKANIPIKESILPIASQPKEWFLYKIGYLPKEEQFDYYEANNIFDKFLDKIAHWIVVLSVLLAFLSPIYVLYLYNKK